ncbi:upf0183 protein at3g51130 [Phtheirospermum japonicum]|uniref:Upf0183 protein at3g51130 n=1 Tax=Phtheirospermum japonicum TaxID=374723 RepID=A0A830DDQ1_9LAMI|nr:upf0183 protein at3g51130 [Phtheirospermum japonicum]
MATSSSAAERTDWLCPLVTAPRQRAGPNARPFSSFSKTDGGRGTWRLRARAGNWWWLVGGSDQAYVFTGGCGLADDLVRMVRTVLVSGLESSGVRLVLAIRMVCRGGLLGCVRVVVEIVQASWCTGFDRAAAVVFCDVGRGDGLGFVAGMEPLKLDIVISFPDRGFHLRFDPWSQRLRLIEIFDVKRLQMRYATALIG